MHFTLSQFINAVLNEWVMSHITILQIIECTAESNRKYNELSRVFLDLPSFKLCIIVVIIECINYDMALIDTEVLSLCLQSADTVRSKAAFW